MKAYETYQRRQHQQELLSLLTEEATSKGRLQGLLPAATWANLSNKLDGLSHPAERVRLLDKAEGRVSLYAGILDEAARLVLVGDNLVDVYGAGGQEERAVPMHWLTVTHLAALAGWQVNGGRLEKGRAGNVAPEPPAALDAAYQAAQAAFVGEPSTLTRLEQALAIVKAGSVQALGGGQWQVGSLAGKPPYLVNGRCECDDHTLRGWTWCKHRLAVALVRKAAELQKERAGSAANTPAPVVL